MSLLLKALRLIPEDIRKDYDEAIRVVPHLVRTESKVADFLQVEDFNLERAAHRMATYWKARKYLFGEDRWLKPLNQTGRGALSPEDVTLLRTGYYVLLPRAQHGVQIIFDETRLPCAAGHTTTRLVFYLTHLYGDISRYGISFVHVVTSGKRPPPDIKLEGWDIYRAALPIRVNQKIVVAQAYEPDKSHLLQYLAFQTQRTAQFRSRQPVALVAGSSFTHTLKLLEQDHGLDRALLPRCLGGNFDYSLFQDWIRMRLSVEGAMAAAPVVANHLPIGETAQDPANNIRRPVLLLCDEKPQGALDQQENDNQRSSKASKVAQPFATTGEVGVSESRKRGKRQGTYARRRLQIKELQLECEKLQNENAQIRQDNRRLESSLAQARFVVATVLSVTKKEDVVVDHTSQ